jgi:hypothetical protein
MMVSSYQKADQIEYEICGVSLPTTQKAAEFEERFNYVINVVLVERN